jgi:guanyl-specific ribonuclease Sa
MRRLLCALIGVALFGTALARDNRLGTVPATALPAEARETLRLIDAGGPFPYRRDGITFQNREGRLPDQPRGYYREYTVPTPGSRDRGARRIVTGAKPPVVFYYTADHYKSFRKVER